MTKTITVRNFFGGCPTCGANDAATSMPMGGSSPTAWHIKSTGVLTRAGSRNPTQNSASDISSSKITRTSSRCLRARGPKIPKFDAAKAWKRGRSSAIRNNVRSVSSSNDVKKVSASVVDALTPFAADMPSDEQIRIRVGPDTELILSAAGVWRQRADDIPF